MYPLNWLEAILRSGSGGDGSDQDVTSPAGDVDRAVRRSRQEIEMSCRIATVPTKRIAQLYVEVKRELRPVNYL